MIDLLLDILDCQRHRFARFVVSMEAVEAGAILFRLTGREAPNGHHGLLVEESQGRGAPKNVWIGSHASALKHHGVAFT